MKTISKSVSSKSSIRDFKKTHYVSWKTPNGLFCYVEGDFDSCYHLFHSPVCYERSSMGRLSQNRK